MNKKVLFEFLKSKVICHGEIFPSEVGISLGNTLSSLIGNLVLDGLQRELYEVQRKCTLLLQKKCKIRTDHTTKIYLEEIWHYKRMEGWWLHRYITLDSYKRQKEKA